MKNKVRIITEEDFLSLVKHQELFLETLHRIAGYNTNNLNEKDNVDYWILPIINEIENGKSLLEVEQDLRKKILSALVTKYRSSEKIARVLRLSGTNVRGLLYRSKILLRDQENEKC